jgi:hypothetical protein
LCGDRGMGGSSERIKTELGPRSHRWTYVTSDAKRRWGIRHQNPVGVNGRMTASEADKSLKLWLINSKLFI